MPAIPTTASGVAKMILFFLVGLFAVKMLKRFFPALEAWV